MAVRASLHAVTMMASVPGTTSVTVNPTGISDPIRTPEAMMLIPLHESASASHQIASDLSQTQFSTPNHIYLPQPAKWP
jgi:hypothetical protein